LRLGGGEKVFGVGKGGNPNGGVAMAFRAYHSGKVSSKPTPKRRHREPAGSPRREPAKIPQKPLNKP
jgi:hypothetical protein